MTEDHGIKGGEGTIGSPTEAEGEGPCGCYGCCTNRFYAAKMLEQEMAKEQFFDRGVPWPPALPNAPFTITLQ